VPTPESTGPAPHPPRYLPWDSLWCWHPPWTATPQAVDDPVWITVSTWTVRFLSQTNNNASSLDEIAGRRRSNHQLPSNNIPPMSNTLAMTTLLL